MYKNKKESEWCFEEEHYIAYYQWDSIPEGFKPKSIDAKPGIYVHR